ncbi:MAG TPA: LytTR family DNA-binding domain-containing protein [Candidatus Eremiobacteraceae bacterium]|nr:LytTR family DNA-binding domain-containing protein [Candidatus Eremiobacteraceae bacterium]
MTRVLIVDDEQSARLRLRQLVARYEDLTIVGECDTAQSARVEIVRLAPDIVFLDIQMPGGSPIEMLRAQTSQRGKPAVIFVTAHSTFGVDAFDVGAADYLLKPFTASRFAKALSRARERLASGSAERLAVRQTDGRTVSLVPSEILWIEAQGNNLTLHLRTTTMKLRSTMASFCERVRDRGFTRIHRSYAVNDSLVRELEPWSHGEYVVIMEDGTRLNSSRTFRENVNTLLEPE